MIDQFLTEPLILFRIKCIVIFLHKRRLIIMRLTFTRQTRHYCLFEQRQSVFRSIGLLIRRKYTFYIRRITGSTLDILQKCFESAKRTRCLLACLPAFIPFRRIQGVQILQIHLECYLVNFNLSHFILTPPPTKHFSRMMTKLIQAIQPLATSTPPQILKWTLYK